MLDTNVVLDWLIFEDGGAPDLMHAIRNDQIDIATTPELIDELTRVLNYPIFALSGERQHQALATYLARVTHHHRHRPLREPIPRCRDKDDQKFLDLAARIGAHALVSKDKAVLGLRRSMKARFNCDVLAPAQSAAWLAAQGATRIS